MKIKQAKKIGWFSLISILVLIIEGFIVGYISEIFPDMINIFGIPFAFNFFIIGITLMILSLMFVLFFPKTNTRRKI